MKKSVLNMAILDKTTIKFLLLLNLMLLSFLNFKGSFPYLQIFPNFYENDAMITTSQIDLPFISNSQGNNKCYCKVPQNGWTAQAGQDEYLFHRIFFQQGLCCTGTFVEFGARNGIADSNTYRFEKDMGWKGLMFEVDPGELPDLERNRPGAHILQGPVCPSYMSNVTIAISHQGGWTGAGDSMEPTRKGATRREINYKCFHLATELRQRNMTRNHYISIDTDGSELDIILDFPWNEFDVRVVQIEQLVEDAFVAQRGKKDRIIQHMTTNFGYKLLGVYQVGKNKMDTDDLIFTSPKLDDYLQMTDYMRGMHPRMTDAAAAAVV